MSLNDETDTPARAWHRADEGPGGGTAALSRDCARELCVLEAAAGHRRYPGPRLVDTPLQK